MSELLGCSDRGFDTDHRRTATARTGLAAALLVALTVCTLAGGDAPPTTAPAASNPATAPLFGGRTGDVRTRLAVSNTFYLELALGAKELRICHSGIAVGTYPIADLRVAYPRILFISRAQAGEWVDDIWTGAHLDPEKVVQRVKIVPCFANRPRSNAGRRDRQLARADIGHGAAGRRGRAALQRDLQPDEVGRDMI